MQARKNAVMVEYMQYKFEDLEIEEDLQTAKANMTTLSPAVRADANVRLEVMETAKMVFMAAVEEGHDVSGMTLEKAVSLVNPQAVKDLTGSSFGKIYTTLNEKAESAVDVTVDAVRTGLSKFAVWLTKVTEEKKN